MKDMQTPTSQRGHIYMKDAHCGETNEKSIFQVLRCLFFELWLILFAIFGDTPEFQSMLPTKKKLSFKSCYIYMKDAHYT